LGEKDSRGGRERLGIPLHFPLMVARQKGSGGERSKVVSISKAKGLSKDLGLFRYRPSDFKGMERRLLKAKSII